MYFSMNPFGFLGESFSGYFTGELSIIWTFFWSYELFGVLFLTVFGSIDYTTASSDTLGDLC